MKATSIALCRVSTAKQREEGNSLEAQEKRVYEAAEYVDGPIEKFWSLNISSRKGKNYNRRDLREMLAYAKEHRQVRFIIVDEVDRFMRSFEEFYYWKVCFREEAGARLVIASKPHLTYKDDMYSLFEEMIDVFKAEASNQERITKTTEKMQARIAAGYYPGVPKQGYQRTMTPGLHEPREPQWKMLKIAFHEVLSQQYNLHEALVRLNAKGYKTTRGSDLDMDRFKTILLDPYYAGILQFSNWTPNPRGLHTAMISPEQHELLVEIVSGKKKIIRKKFNEKYRLSNLLGCTDCLEVEDAKYPRVVGYDHNNGKPGNKRKVYEKYRCRACKKEHPREFVHSQISNVLAPLGLSPAKRREFTDALRVVWQQEHQDNARFVQSLQTRLNELTVGKDNLVLAMASGRINDVDGQSALAGIKSSIKQVEDELGSAQDIEQDFVEFVEFTMAFIDKLQDEWWQLDQKHLRWCKQLLFPEGFSISREGKVHTPVISEFYRVATSDSGSMVTRIQKSLHQLKDEAGRWREIAGPVYDQQAAHLSERTPLAYTHLTLSHS